MSVPLTTKGVLVESVGILGARTALSMIEEKTKEYEKLVRRVEEAVEWLQKQNEDVA